jgi:hypothetical protein
MPSFEFLAEVFGWLGLAGCCLWSFARTRSGMTTVQLLLSGPGFLLHWALQGHWTAALSCGLMLGLAAASLALEGPPDSSKVRLARALFLLLLPAIALTAALTWEGTASAFAAIGTAMVCLARWQLRPKRLRALLLLSSIPWLGHNLLVWSLPGIGADLFCLSRAAMGWWEGRAAARGKAPLPA